MARVQPADWQHDPELADLVTQIRVERGRLGALYPVMLNSPVAVSGLLALGNAVRFRSVLDAGLREMVICLVGERLGATYELFRHRELADHAGVPGEKIDGLRAWRDSSHYTELERSVFDYVDCVTHQASVPDAIFEAVRSNFADNEIVELTLLASYYNMICRVLNSLEITPADEAQE